MKIDKVEVFLVSTAIPNPPSDSTRTVASLGYVVVCLHTDDGLTGIGITYHEIGGAAIRSLIEKDLAGLLLGRDPLATEVLWERIFHYVRGVGRKGLAFCALSVIDIALWDLKGKMLGLPLYRLLGGERKELPVYASGGWTSYDERQLLEELQGMVAAGYNMVKMKVGVADGKRPDLDVRRVQRVRRELGEEIGIMLDANNAFQAAAAIRLGHQLAEENILLFEEPVLADDLEGLARVRASIDIPVATGEHEYTKYGARDLVKYGAADIIQVDAARCGGVTEWQKIAALTQAWNLSLAPHCMDYLHMHLVSAAPNGLFLERLQAFEPLNEIVFVDPPQPQGGILTIPDGPGLGLVLNMENVRKYNED